MTDKTNLSVNGGMDRISWCLSDLISRARFAVRFGSKIFSCLGKSDQSIDRLAPRISGLICAGAIFTAAAPGSSLLFDRPGMDRLSPRFRFRSSLPDRLSFSRFLGSPDQDLSRLLGSHFSMFQIS
ncbi:hypothetical protein NPIL_120061 [Nephila pilipes]|uniref:Uncharacterized protein n=1 Tax=Nephila pilipes TaxID=299642 RepID=A0A8X6Q8K9_NEPPI|nr:hypothetical protein NPIL_120061 [Nephila pilipes]